MNKRSSWRAWRPHLVAAGLLVAVLASCALAPVVSRDQLEQMRAATPGPAASTSTRTLAVTLDARGPRGALDEAGRQRLVQRLAQQGGGPLLHRHLAAMAAFGEVDLLAGNSVQLLVDGPATFAAMFDAISRARHSILLESYIIEDVSVAARLADLLKRKRAEGVNVAIIYDAVGSLGTDASFFDNLRLSGILVCAFNPVNPVQRPGYWGISHRDHRKILTVDRRVAFTGGINISGVYASGSFGRRHQVKVDPDNGWRDTQLAIQGTAAEALDDLVRDTWRQQGCEGALQPPVVPAAAAVNVSQRGAATGGAVLRIVASTPHDPVNPIHAMLLGAIEAAQRSVHLTMAYFAPGDEMVQALCDAARRGVDVQLILPMVSDFKPVLYAGQSRYAQLLDAGVRIHELETAVLHAKTAVIDGVVSTVGSSNLDWRSFSANNEVNAVVLGQEFGDDMARMFRRDLAASREVTAEAWQRRAWTRRLREQLAVTFERWW
jgi:cardiolipin synthase A/B